MIMSHRIVITLERKVEEDADMKQELKTCIREAKWLQPAVPPKEPKPILNLQDFYDYLNELINSTPVDSTFDNMFHGIFYIISHHGNKLQRSPKFAWFQEWLVLFVEQFGCYMNTAESANNLFSFTNDPTFRIQDFIIPPGGFSCFNSFFARNIKPGKRPIGARTLPYDSPSEGHPLPDNPKDENYDLVHKNMFDDDLVTVPADSVYKVSKTIDEKGDIRVPVSKGNEYAINELLKGSKYADSFNGGMFTHSYLTVFTYHRYHVPVRGIIKDAGVISGKVFAKVVRHGSDLSAKDPTGYQFNQDRAYIVIESPIGLVGLVAVGMDFISSCNISVDVGDYVNKGDEWGYFLFGGSDMIMLFDKNDIDIQLPEKDKLYKLGQVFGRVKK